VHDVMTFFEGAKIFILGIQARQNEVTLKSPTFVLLRELYSVRAINYNFQIYKIKVNKILIAALRQAGLEISQTPLHSVPKL